MEPDVAAGRFVTAVKPQLFVVSEAVEGSVSHSVTV